MSFELKPIEGSNPAEIDDIVWSHPRDEVPFDLQDRIDLDMWQKTFDAVKDHYQTLLEESQNNRPRGLVHLLFPHGAPGQMNKLKQIALDHENGWLQLLHQQAEIYKKAGVHVALAKELKRDEHCPNMRIEQIVGLTFEVGPPPRCEGNGATRLRKMEQLYRLGVISRSELNNTRYRILGEMYDNNQPPIGCL